MLEGYYKDTAGLKGYQGTTTQGREPREAQGLNSSRGFLLMALAVYPSRHVLGHLGNLEFGPALCLKETTGGEFRGILGIYKASISL